MNSRVQNTTLFVLGSLIGSTPAADAAQALASATFTDCYRLALQTSETLAASEEEIRVLEGRYAQLRAAILPDARWKWSNTWQDRLDGAGSGSFGTSSKTRSQESYFSATQPLFKGFRELSAMSAGKAEIRAARYDRDQIARDLLSEVADVFTTAVIAERDIEILEESRRITEDRIADLEKRVRLGKSRMSEVLSTRVQLATLKAQIEERRGTRNRAREVLQFLTRLPYDTRLIPPDRPPVAFALEASLAKAARRPDVLAEEERLRSAMYQIRYAKSGYSPLVDIEGRYYTHREGTLSSIDWDAVLTVEVPIFQGGITHGAVREARSREIQQQLTLARLKRRITQEVRAAHSDLEISLVQHKAYQEAVALGLRNYQSQQEEYRLGLTTNLELLRLLSDIEELKRQEARALATAFLDEVRLRVATGEGL